MYTRRLMSIYKVYSIGPTWSWPVMSAPACFSRFHPDSEEKMGILSILIKISSSSGAGSFAFM